MYLQITTKCNMTCDHCCYSCGKRGRHGKRSTIMDGISFAREHDDETISIGGGEPTLHPDFFDFLKECVDSFNYVWMATNGSQTETMYRLLNIMDANDFPDCDCEEGDCYCEGGIYQEGKLSVALSLDYFHDQIDDRIVDIWRQCAKSDGWNHSNFEVRDVTQAYSGVIAQGRAVTTGSGWNEVDCVCSDLLIRPNGRIKLCGCTRAPFIGDIWQGIDKKWDDIIWHNDKFNDERCYKALKKV